MPAPRLRPLARCAAVACLVVALVAQGATAAGSGMGAFDKADARLVEGRWQEGADLGEAAGTASAFVARLNHGARASKALEHYGCALKRAGDDLVGCAEAGRGLLRLDRCGHVAQVRQYSAVRLTSICGTPSSGSCTSGRPSGWPSCRKRRVARRTGVVPSAYREGVPRANAVHPLFTANYVAHTRVGDPLLDPVMQALRDLDPEDLHRFIGAGIDQRPELKHAPRALREFFRKVDEPPAWLDYEAHRPARQAFHAYSTNVLVAFVAGVLIEGFSTLIAKSFAMTGRVLTPDSARRRLMQNNRHLLEVFFPGGLERNGDGWKLSMRLRFVHARVRDLLANSGVWDAGSLGTPISAAHLGFATSVFSARLLRHAAKVGAVFDKEEQESVMQVWRYTGHVMGVPDAMLFTDKAHAELIFEIARVCEPSPDADSAVMANALIGAIPLVAGIEDTAEQQRVRQLAYRLSRALIGDDLADQLAFPKTWTLGTLRGFRLKQWWEKSRAGAQGVRSQNFTQMLDISVYDDPNVTYRMPDHWDSRKSSPW